MSQDPGRAGAARYGHHGCASDGRALALLQRFPLNSRNGFPLPVCVKSPITLLSCDSSCARCVLMFATFLCCWPSPRCWPPRLPRVRRVIPSLAPCRYLNFTADSGSTSITRSTEKPSCAPIRRHLLLPIPWPPSPQLNSCSPLRLPSRRSPPPSCAHGPTPSTTTPRILPTTTCSSATTSLF